jgi:cyclase
MRSVRPSRHFRTERLGPGVYAAIATPEGYALCNAGIVDLGGRTVVFDSMLTPMAASDLARAAEKLTGRPPDWVVNSHWHGDHIWGNSAFPSAHIVSTRRVREVILRKSRRQFDRWRREFPSELAQLDRPDSAIPPVERPGLRGWLRGVIETPTPFRIVPPGVTFEEELRLEGTRRTLRLITYGGGHSPSDVFAYLEDERIVFAGDLVMVGLHPSVSDGWPRRWIQILERMERLRVEQNVPGHGPVGGAEAIGTMRRYLRDLEQAVARSIRKGENARSVRSLRIPERYQDWRFSFMYPDNVARAYQLARRDPS